MNRHVSQLLNICITFSVLLLLPNCAPLKWIKEKLGVAGEVEKPSTQQCPPVDSDLTNDGSPVIASIAGKPIITEKSFKRDFDDFLVKNPQIKQFLPFMSNAEEQYFQGLLRQKLVDHYVVTNKLDKSPDYQNDLQEFIKAGRQMLNTKYFMAQHATEISDSEARDFYNQHKTELPEALISHGGTRTVGIQFKTKEEAQEFLNKIASKPTEFESTARAQGLGDRIQDFKSE